MRAPFSNPVFSDAGKKLPKNAYFIITRGPVGPEIVKSSVHGLEEQSENCDRLREKTSGPVVAPHRLIIYARFRCALAGLASTTT